jgi:AraC-like DNA-binding protein
MNYLDDLAESLYLAPKLSESEVEQKLRTLGLKFPLLIVVERSDDDLGHGKSKKKGNKYYWSPHHGLIYILWSKPAGGQTKAPDSKQLQSEIVECGQPGQFVNRLLDAVVSFRRRELQEVLEGQPQDLSFAAELDARRLAIKKIQLASIERTPFAQHEWHSAVELWLDIMLLRHLRHLHTVRRKLQEFLSLLTCDLDKCNPLGNSYSQAQRFVQETYSLAELRAGFSIWLIELLEEFPGQSGWSNDSLSPFCRQAVEWMELHYSEPISVADCAAAIHLNPSYLSRIFKKETGRNLVHYLQKLRIDQARKLLQQNRHNISELAGLCGFGSVEHFHRVFVRQVGMTPARYRRNTRPG